jgi:hypothetical protein
VNAAGTPSTIAPKRALAESLGFETMRYLLAGSAVVFKLALFAHALAVFPLS